MIALPDDHSRLRGLRGDLLPAPRTLLDIGVIRLGVGAVVPVSGSGLLLRHWLPIFPLDVDRRVVRGRRVVVGGRPVVVIGRCIGPAAKNDGGTDEHADPSVPGMKVLAVKPGAVVPPAVRTGAVRSTTTAASASKHRLGREDAEDKRY